MLVKKNKSTPVLSVVFESFGRCVSERLLSASMAGANGRNYSKIKGILESDEQLLALL